eukprot:bmy_05146T0
MGEKNGDAKTFWMELEDDGKVDFIFEQVQNVLQSLKQKIKDGSATNKDHTSVTQNAQENKSSSLPSTSHEDSFPEDYTSLYVYKLNLFMSLMLLLPKRDLLLLII